MYFDPNLRRNAITWVDDHLVAGSHTRGHGGKAPGSP
jgi:hypothetical protein